MLLRGGLASGIDDSALLGGLIPYDIAVGLKMVEGELLYLEHERERCVLRLFRDPLLDSLFLNRGDIEFILFTKTVKVIV